jgi:1,4-dihydroxy-2-naphthoate octaprenyltransferase
MPALRKIFSQAALVFFYCNFFIALCAASLVYETVFLLHLSKRGHWFALLVFVCTLNIYTFHYYLKSRSAEADPRLDWYRKNKLIILLLLAAGGLAIVSLIHMHSATLFNVQNLLWTLVIPALSIAYSFPFLPGGRALRHTGWLKLPLLSLVWSFTTVFLPVLYDEKISVATSQLWILFINRILLITALAMLFNVRDYTEDKKAGIRTPAVLLGPAVILSRGKWLFCLLNLAAAILLIQSFHFKAVHQYAAVLLPVILLFLLFHYFRFDRSEPVFVCLYDGLMPFKALLLIFAAL